MTDMWSQPTGTVTFTDPPAQEDEAPTETTETYFVVDAITNAVYAGFIHESLQEVYDSKDKRLVPSARTAHINGVQPVLARFATRKNDETNMDETTWYPVTDGNMLALTGAIPGEWKMVHILSESEV